MLKQTASRLTLSRETISHLGVVQMAQGTQGTRENVSMDYTCRKSYCGDC
jgi:hypothetical protein